MSTTEQELKKAIEFVRKTFAEKNIQLDYSPESVRHLDKLFDQEFKKGKLKRPESSFAKYQGLIMIGVSGYLAEVVLKNTSNTRLHIESNDSNWYINFLVAGNNGLTIQPGKVVLARIQEGDKAELYKYAIYALNYFGTKTGEKAVEKVDKKPWWKFG